MGVIPLLGGDVSIKNSHSSTIVSADELAIKLAERFRHPSIVFLTDTAGLYHPFPPKNGQTIVRRISRRMIRELTTTKQRQLSRRDVTGGMIGKLRQLRNLRHGLVVIADGRKHQPVQGALADRYGTQFTV